MQTVLYQYELNPTTWVYLSSFLMIVVFFKFRRFFSVRNLDLLGLIAMAPGLLMVAHGTTTNSPASAATSQVDSSAQAAAPPLGRPAADRPAAGDPSIAEWGYVWLFVVGAFFMIRLLSDPLMVRRPLLEPNLSADGLTFLALVLFVFLMANVVTAKLPGDGLGDVAQTADAGARAGAKSLGFPLLDLLPHIPSQSFTAGAAAGKQQAAHDNFARVLAILSHLAVVVGLVVIGHRHFENVRTGIAAAALYLLVPYTAQLVGHIDHVLPAALLVWVVASYRSPLIAGMLLGLATGLVYYPVFLLPLWIGFYWQRGLLRFAGGVVASLTGVAILVALVSSDFGMIFRHFQQMFLWTGLSGNVEGFWATSSHQPFYRLPIIALYLVMCFGMAIWPAQKNLGTLMSCSAAVMLGAQFWFAQGGLLYVNWYLPLLLLTIFRPNLENRVAVTSLGESWFLRRREVSHQAA